MKQLGQLSYETLWLSWGHWHQKQVSQAWISNFIPQNIVVCNYLSLPKIPASGANVVNYRIIATWSLIYYLIYLLHVLTHWGLVTSHGDRDLGQHWLRQWLDAWRHQAITWTNVDLSLARSCDIHLRPSSQEIPQPSISEIVWKIKYLKYHSSFPGANELSNDVHIFGEM